MANKETEEKAYQEYWNNIQSGVPSEMWGFMGFLLTNEYVYGAFKRNVPVDMVVRYVENEFNKSQSAMTN